MNARNDNNIRRYNDGLDADFDDRFDAGIVYENHRGYTYEEPRDYGYEDRRRYAYGEPRGYAYEERCAYAPEYVMYDEPRSSSVGAIVVAVMLAAALGGAGAFFATTQFGKVQPSTAAKSQVVQVQGWSTTNAPYTTENGSYDAPVSNYTAEQCRDHALEVFNKDGQATNITVSGIIWGGGANHCDVEFDKDGQHYVVQVCADNCHILNGSSTDATHETMYDENGYIISSREL